MMRERTKPTPASRTRPAFARRPGRLPRRAFSLAEMMIAIVILGLGLLMAASMFPVAWLRARDLAEFTNQTTATDAAQTTVRLLCRATGARDTSFLGDRVDDDPVTPVYGGDGDVHVLHVENLLADEDGSESGWPEWVKFDANLGGLFSGDFHAVDPVLSSLPPFVDWLNLVGLMNAQISFQERLLPPLPRRPLPTDVPVPTQAEIDRWNKMLSSRRFAWSALYKLDAAPSTPSATRSFTMYFVTLRRTQAGLRFARQDDQGGVPVLPTTEPQALDEQEDMLFPVPWLINLKVHGTWDSVSGAPVLPGLRTGVPSELDANPDPQAPNSRLAAQMVQNDSVLIDRLTGDMYTVKQHRFTGSGSTFDHQARMTIDQEINPEDYGLDPLNDTVNVGALPPATNSDLRDFWVFPPPVARGDGAPDPFPNFDGRQPVVGIEVRQMYFTP